MVDDLKFAWRNVWRNTRRSVVTICAAAIALFVMIFYTGLVSGYLEGLENNILDLEVGEGQAFAEGYREKPSLYTAIEAPDDFVQSLEDAGYEASPRLRAVGLGAGQDNSSGVEIIGLDVEADAQVSKIHEHVASGSWLQPDDEGVVLGRRLAETLNLGVGDELVLLSQGADGSMANDLYTVRGVLQGISERVDRGGVFMTHARFRELMVFPKGVHQIIYRIPEGMELGPATDKARAMAPEGVEVASWKEIQPVLGSMLESAAGAMKVMMAIIYLAVAIVILNAMLMAVFERIRELGVLKAIGFGPGKIFALIMMETAIQTGFAVLVGVLVAIPVNAYMVRTGLDLSALGNVSIMGVAWDPVWRSKVDADTYITPTISLVSIVAVAVIYPALRAAFIRPLDAIHRS